MNGPHQDKNNFVPDLSSLSGREEELVRQVEEDSIVQWREEELKEQAQHCLYQRFQQTAAALTQVYQGQVEEGRDWQPFQTAAGSLTLLYKDSLEELRKAAEVNRKLGHQRSRQDITTWAKSKRRFIRREELLAFLCSNSPGPPAGGGGGGGGGVEAGGGHEEAGLDRLSLGGGGGGGGGRASSRNTVMPSLQDMLDLSRLGGCHQGRKRSGPPSPQQDEEMEHSPQSKRFRKN